MNRYDDIINYNLSYKIFLKAAETFEGYLLGLSSSDLNQFFNADKDHQIEILYKIFQNKNPIYPKPTNKELSGEQKEIENFIKNIAVHILDRMTGSYFLKDVIKVSNTQLESNVTNNIGNFLQILHTHNSGKMKVENLVNNPVKNAGTGNAFIHTTGKTISYYLINNDIPEQAALDDNGASLTRPFNPATDNEGQAYDNAAGEKVVPLFKKDLKSVNVSNSNLINPETSGKVGSAIEPNRYIAPSLGAYVFKHFRNSYSSRGINHLPVFFSGLKDLEVAKSVPFIDIQILTEEIGKSNDTLNQVNRMFFIKNNNSNKFESFYNLYPAGYDINDNNFAPIKNTNFSYMDIFTSPSTMSFSRNKNYTNSFINSPGNNNDPILEPIMPLMTLESLNVNITGAGIGLLSSKSADMSIVLHDRSLMSEIGPLISSDQFARTKIIIEYGWKHPEGGPNSDNIIGQYINGLRDRSIYSVISTNYSFGGGSAVKINVKLAAYGYKSIESIHCGAGPTLPFVNISEFIEKAAEVAITTLLKDNGNDKKRAKEVRKKIKLYSRNGRNINSSLSWESYQIIAKLFYNNQYETLITIIKEIMINLEENKNFSEKSNQDSLIMQMLKQEIQIALQTGGKNTTTMHKNVVGKLKYIEKNNAGNDPFLNEYVYGANQFSDSESSYDVDANLNNDVVSLGKVLMSFIGHSVAASCLYDEVQMFFYPLNHQAGGARKYTTASFPIPISKLSELIEDGLNKNSQLSVKSFFNMLEKNIIKDKNLPAYELDSALINLNKLKLQVNDIDKRLFVAKLIVDEEIDFTGLGIDSLITQDDYNNLSNIIRLNIDNDNNSRLTESINSGEIFRFSNSNNNLSGVKILDEIFKRYSNKINSELKTSINSLCSKLYDRDGLKNYFPTAEGFVMPNLNIDFEIVPVINVVSDLDPKIGWFKKYFKNNSQNNGSGLYDNKTIMKIHVYDEEAITSPEIDSIINTFSDNLINTPIDSKNNNLSIYKTNLNNLSFNDVKNIIKRSYPTIIYGSNSSVVKSINVSSNTTDGYSNVLAIETYGKTVESRVAGNNDESEFEEVVLIPNTLSVTMLGMPVLTRGMSVFIDFNTDTNLDNLYTIISSNHSLSSGNYTTTVNLVPTHTGKISSFREKLAKTIGAFEEYVKK